MAMFMGKIMTGGFWAPKNPPDEEKIPESPGLVLDPFVVGSHIGFHYQVIRLFPAHI